MARTYTLQKRAERQADTHRRIVEATVDLHSRIGPAATTLSMIAQRAGVQRHTLYAHFPNERDLFMACSGLALERDPLPDTTGWQDIDDPGARLRQGLAALYGWYARNADLAACILRDAEHHPLTKEIIEIRFGPPMRSYFEILGSGLDTTQRAMLRVALSFFTWRTLVLEAQTVQAQAPELMAHAIMCAGQVCPSASGVDRQWQTSAPLETHLS